jgi:hypothetical protein
MMAGQELDPARVRWLRFRERLHLTDTTDERFALGGLAGQYAVDPRARLFVLPRDPEALPLDFSEDFWTWWLQERADPATGRQTAWGVRHRPTVDAAVRFSQEAGGSNWAAPPHRVNTFG